MGGRVKVGVGGLRWGVRVKVGVRGLRCGWEG